MLGSAVHHPAFAAHDGWPETHRDCEIVYESILRQHAPPKYAVSPAYNDLPCQHGSVLPGRGPGRLSGANGTTWANLNFWAFCALLPIGHDPTSALLNTLRDLIDNYPGPGRDVQPHSAFVASACPNPPLTAWIALGALRPPEEDDMPLTNDDLEKITAAIFDRRGDFDSAFDVAAERAVNTATFKAVVNAVVDLKRYIDLTVSAGGGLTEAQARKIIADEVRHQLDQTRLAPR